MGRLRGKVTWGGYVGRLCGEVTWGGYVGRLHRDATWDGEATWGDYMLEIAQATRQCSQTCDSN